MGGHAQNLLSSAPQEWTDQPVPPDIPMDREIAWLIDQGLSEKALLNPTAILGASVKFLGGKTFDFDPEGVRAFIFKVEDFGCNIDLVAWEPKRGSLATWRGVAFALGQDAIFNPASYFDGSALGVHRTPLEWLRAERSGVVILRPDLAYAYLAHRQRLSFPSVKFASQVEHWIRPKPATAKLFVRAAT
jgi:hypothetical protein